jgi:hypothetical protein
MEPVRLSGEEFAGILDSGEAYERIADSGSRVVLVDGDRAPDMLDASSMQRLHTLPAVVVGAVADPERRRPAWADVVVGADPAPLESIVSTVQAVPLAATTLAILLRTGDHRSIPEGLVAESIAYGLLQGGPEFAAWRRHHPPRRRTSVPGPEVLVSRHDHELSITLNRPHVLNAFDAAMRDELLATIRVASLDPSITSVVLRGAGDSFCSGGDLDEFGSRPDPVTGHLVRLQRNCGRAIAEVADRTTVHIHGSTVGSGIELAAFAHRVVAAPSARISLPEVHLGLIPGAGGTVSLPKRIGRHATILLALGLPSIDADTALRWGLVDEVEA